MNEKPRRIENNLEVIEEARTNAFNSQVNDGNTIRLMKENRWIIIPINIVRFTELYRKRGSKKLD